MTTVVPYTDVPGTFAAQQEMSRLLAGSNLLPGHLRGNAPNVFLILTGAQALNVPAFWALQSFHVVDGKLSISAEMMRALVIRAGHSFRVVERSAERATVEITRFNDRITSKLETHGATFTADDAKQAGLLGKNNWKNYPAAMLVARATSIAVREACPEVLFGMVYTPEELGAVVDEDGTPIPVSAPPAQWKKPGAESNMVALWLTRFQLLHLEDLEAVWDDIDRYEVDAASLMSLTHRFMVRILAEFDEAPDRQAAHAIYKIVADCNQLDIWAVSADDNGDKVTLGNYLVRRGKELFPPEIQPTTTVPVQEELPV